MKTKSPHLFSTILLFILLNTGLVSCRLLLVKRQQQQFPSSPAILQKKLEEGTEHMLITNDPAIKKKWGLNHIDAYRAWALSKGNRHIVVAVIDTGIDLHHEDLKENLWVNPGETGWDALGRNKRTNKIDDDQNGYVDDVHGWNFVQKNHQLMDNHGHGTHIAGIIGAVGNNGKGVSGVAPRVQLMTLKYYDNNVVTDYLRNTVDAIHYAVKMKADIINYSGGGLSFSQAEREAIHKAKEQGILFVAAAGNEASNADEAHYYPASYNLPNIVSVTAIDDKGNMVSSSNWGINNVDVAAPGRAILSTLPSNAYGYMTGTSQATAYVSGAAALIMDRKQYTEALKVKKHILQTGDIIDSLHGRIRTAKKLNLFKALALSDKDESLLGRTVLLNDVNQNARKINRTQSDRNLSYLHKLFAKEGGLPTLKPALGSGKKGDKLEGK